MARRDRELRSEERNGSRGDPAGDLPESSAADEVERWMAAVLACPEDERVGALERLCGEHPSHATEIRGRWQALGNLGAALRAQSAAGDAFPERLGDFRLLERLGEGGMGAVYLARQEALGRQVALKLIRSEQLFFAGARERFRREVEAVARLSHPGIVPIFCVGEESGVPYFAMEYVRGCSLAEILGQLSSRELAELRGADLADALSRTRGAESELGSAVALPELFRGTWVQASFHLALLVADALEHAHRRGVLHRDVKPSNILVTPAGRVLLVDFGLARIQGESRMTRTGAEPGSLPYMAPEQLAGASDEARERTDVYALGVTLYELLTLRLPYLSQRSEETRRLVLEGKPRSVRSANPAVARDAETVCLKAMERDAKGRYATAALLARDLRNVLELRPIEARRTGLAKRAMRYAQRRPARFVAAVLGFILAVIVPTVFGLYERSKRVEADRKEYAANLLAASASLYGNEIREARRLLESCKEASRGWEWSHLQRRCDDSVAVLEGHPAAVHALVFSGDGQRMVSAGKHGSILVWDAGAGSIQSQMSLPAGSEEAEVLSVALSADGTSIAAGLHTGQILVWRTSSPTSVSCARSHPPHPVTAQAAVLGVAFSPDGERLYSGSWNGEVRAWGLASERSDVLLRDPNGKRVNCIALDSAGSHIAAGTADGYVRVLDTQSGELVAEARDGGADVRSLAFSPDGSRIAAASDDTLVRLWKIPGGERLHVLRGHAREIGSTAFSPDGSRLATAALDRTVRLWDADNGDPLAVHWGHDEAVNAVAFTRDGTRIVSGSDDRTLREWDATAADVLVRAWILSMAASPDGSTLLTGSWDGKVRMWDAASGAALMEIFFEQPAVLAVAFAPDGRRFAAGGAGPGRIVLWDRATGERVPGFRSTPRDVRSLAFSPECTRLAAAGEDRTVWILDGATGVELAALRGHAGPVNGIAFSPLGERIASASDDQTVRTWDPVTGEALATLSGHAGRVLRVAFSPDGRRIASASEDRTLRLWDAASGASVAELRGHERAIDALAFSPDGGRIVSGSRDGTLRVWNAESFELLTILRGHAKDVVGLAFTPDGVRLYSGSGDQTLRVWDSLPAARLRVR